MGCRLVLHTGFRASGVAGFCWMMGSGLDWIGLDWIGRAGWFHRFYGGYWFRVTVVPGSGDFALCVVWLD